MAQIWLEISNVKAGLKKCVFCVYCFFAVNVEYVIKHQLYPLQLGAS